MASLMSIFLWLLWNNRNCILHNEQRQSTVALCAKGISLARDLGICKPSSEGCSHRLAAPWRRARSLFLKIHTDASFLSDDLLSGGGWICRDEYGNLVRGGGGSLQASSSLVAPNYFNQRN